MVLCSRCQLSENMQPCLVGGHKPCLVCQEDMELERAIQELQEKRRILRRRMNASHDPFVLAFPPEISSHILLLSMGEWDYNPCGPYDSGVLLKKLPTPFLLGTVCRGWRQLARSTPQLWTTLSFTLAKPTKVSLLEAVRDWLQLSGSLPLTIYVSSYEGENPVSEEIYGPVVDALNQHSGRWHKVVLCLHAPYFRHFCGSSPPSNLYKLEVINYGHLDIDDLLPTIKMNFKPSPTNLTIRYIGLSANDIGWGNLTYLSMEGMTFNECVDAIRQARLLESCTIFNIYSGPGDISIPKTIIRHMRLRKLDLNYAPEKLFIDLLDSMECPALEEFSHEAIMNNLMVDSLVSLLNRSESRLKELNLDVDGEEDLAVECYKDLLNAIPSLQHLNLRWDINGVFFMDYLLQKLSSSAPIVEGGTPVFLPYLQSLTYSSYFREVPMWEYIPHIYTWPHRKFLRLDLKVLEIEIDDNTSDKISQLIAQGVRIRVRAGREDFIFRSLDTGLAGTGA